MFADAVGGKGYLVRTSEELQKAAEEGFKAKVGVLASLAHPKSSRSTGSGHYQCSS